MPTSTSTHCLACGGELREAQVFRNMPAGAQHFPDKAGLAQDKAIDLRLCQCKACGLVQLSNEPVWYYRDVIRAGGGTSTMRDLRHAEYNKLLRYLGVADSSAVRILEVGCGQGEFLQMWDQFERRYPGLSVAGLEHSRDNVTLARGHGLNVVQGFAEDGCFLQGVPFDAFVQFNFLEHQPDPADMLRWVHAHLARGAYGLATVPSLEYILDHGNYYELLRDHIAYYSIDSLASLFERTGFSVIESSIVNLDTIEMVVRRRDSSDDMEAQREMSPTTYEADFSRLIQGYTQLSSLAQKHCEALRDDGQTMAVWGASHQGFTFISSLGLADSVRYIIDSAAFKQGFFAPASHVPIVAPEHFFEEPVDEILIAAPGYAAEIADIITHRFGREVRISSLSSEGITGW